ncbi:MAG TPA: 50S ribosomal protein L32 [Candidatus Hydrogenedens sp.]|nr:50S ribosomal protein L32 [Candidatus Hydrogenedens sp.]
MPVPKRRTGKAKKNMRRSHHAIGKPNLVECPHCSEKILPHRVCPKCGYYKNRLVLNLEEE